MLSEPQLVVLDSSVGVKWIKPEAGREQAMALLAAHRDGEVRIVVASLFMHEVLAVAVSRGGVERGAEVWRLLSALDLTVVGLDDTVARVALEQCRSLGCAFYDALAPALAGLLDATMYSADVRAHARFAGVELVGT